MTSPGEGELGFEQDIKPLFRSKDRDSIRVTAIIVKECLGF